MTPIRFFRLPFAACTLFFTAVVFAAGHPARAAPIPPCTTAGPMPAYAAPDTNPAVEILHATTLEGTDECLGLARGPMDLTIILSGRFNAAPTIPDIAARIGAISLTTGLVYWSTTRQAWKPLIAEAYAVTGIDGRIRRGDFTAAEILDGEPHYFVQEDTLSSGRNIYELTGQETAPGSIRIEITNITPVRFLFVTMFQPRNLIAVHYLTRLENGTLGYYGISAVRAGAMEGNEKSFVNRANAFYRFLTDIPADREPPLAP